MKINPNDPTHPVMILGEDARMQEQHKGMPIRLELAARFMAGFCANPTGHVEPALDASMALRCADALLKAYSESEAKP